MRVFWIIVGVVVLLTAALFVFRSRAGSGGSGSDSGRAPADATRGLAVPGPADQQAERLQQETERVLGESAASKTEATTATGAGAGAAPRPAPADNAEPLHQTGAELNAALFGEGDGPSKAAKAAAKAVDPAAATGTGSGGGAGGGGGTGSRSGPAQIEKRADGSMLVDKRFVIKGAGTRESPYEITWEFLTSAQETYQPRLGLKNIPDRLNIVHNKYVSISGYIAFPVLAATADEMLMMLNQWDGCCIGVPPTPYDAIEVKLAEPASREQKLAIDGAVTGLIKVDPYLVKDWLVSMYIMDDARLVRDSSSGPEKKVRVPGEHSKDGEMKGEPPSAAPSPQAPAVDPLSQP